MIHRPCATLPGPMVAKALRAAVGFASHDRAVWSQTRRLERLRDHSRIRLGIHQRLLIYWRPGDALRILDLIPREDLASWIQRHA